MLNADLLRLPTDLNPFTARLRELCLAKGQVMVRMRNGLWVEVVFQDEVPDEHSLGFRTPDYDRLWEPNGKSFTTSDFDLIEFRG